MTPQEFITANSEKYFQARAHGLDIRMYESEIFEWMERYRTADLYRYLKIGEIIQEGDEVDVSANYNDRAKWEKAAPHTIGIPAPDPQYPAHRVYRRLLKGAKIE